MRYMNERKSTNHAIVGKQNHDNGEMFEEIIKRSCERYIEDGIAAIEKTPEPMRPIKSLGSGRFIACFEKKAQPDFKGSIKGGTTVAFEAKFTDTDRIRQTVVTDEQAKALNQHHSMGAICFVVVSFSFYDFFRIPWTVWRNMKQIYGRKYLMPCDIEDYEIKFTGYELKFLDGIVTQTK